MSRSKITLQETLSMINNPKDIPTFVAAIIGVGLLQAVTYDLIKLIGSGWAILVGVLLTSILMLVLVYYRVRQTLKRLMNTELKPKVLAFASPHRGLILLVSNNWKEPGTIPPACQSALEHHWATLDYCWLLYSSQSEDEKNATTAYIEAKNSSTARTVRIEGDILIADVYSIEEVRDRIDTIYRQLPDALLETDVIADFTGMTVLASVGMVLACLNPERMMQYTPQNASGGSFAPHAVVLSYEDIRERSAPPEVPMTDETSA